MAVSGQVTGSSRPDEPGGDQRPHVVILGTGPVARQAAGHLLHTSTARLTLAGIRGLPEEPIDHPRVEIVTVDPSDQGSLEDLMASATLCLNLAHPFGETALPVARACLATGCPLIDGCDDPATTQALLDLDTQAHDAGLTMVTGLTWTPGLATLMVRQAYEDLYGASRARVTWVADLRELATPAVRDQAVALLASGHGEPLDVAMPKPLGPVSTLPARGSELALIEAGLEGLSQVELRGGLLPEAALHVARTLDADQGLGELARSLGAAVVARADEALGARGPTVSGVRVDAWVQDGDHEEQATYTVVDQRARIAGLTAGLGATWFLEERLPQSGVHSPAAVIEPGPFFQALGQHGVVVSARDPA